MPGDMATPSQPKKALIAGAFWTVGTRWAIKSIGFINTVITARLLMPADYGVVALSMLVVELLQTLLDFGAVTALLRKRELSRDEIDSAWTLRLIQCLIVAALMVAVAPFASGYFDEPRVQNVLWVMAACVGLGGLANIGLTLALKTFKFAIEFKVNVIAKVASVVATIAAAYLIGDYRALVIGLAVGYAVGLVLSYTMHPYRPRWNTSKIGEIWAVTKWLMVAGIGNFLLRKSDELVAGRVGTTAEYGAYNVGSDLGRLPVGQLGPAMMRAFLPVLSSIQTDIRRTNQAVLKTMSAANSITLPMGFGAAALATHLTLLVLGHKWDEAAPIVAVFAIVASVHFATSPLNSLLVLRGHTRTQSTVVWIEFVVFALAALLLVSRLHLIGLVWARLIAGVVNAGVVALYARSRCGVSLRSMAAALWRPLLGSVGMYVAVVEVVAHMDTLYGRLLAGVGTGVLSYSLWLVLSWLAVGRPEGLESTVFDALRARIRRGRGGGRS